MNATQASERRSFAALHHAGFRAFFLTNALAMTADSVEHVISYWMIFQKFHSPALGGFAVISHWLPFLLFSVWSGALNDRFDSRRLIQIGMVLFAGVSLAWGLLFALDVIEVWHAVVLLIVHGFAGVLWGPANQVMIHDIVGPSQLQSAIRLNATARQLGLLAGPAVGSALMLLAGPTVGILFNALLYVPVILWLWRAPYGPRFRSEPAPPQRPIRGLADIVQTVRDIAGDRAIVSMTLLAGGASLLVGNSYQAQMPEFAHDFGHGEAGTAYSALLGADAAGALVAGVLLEARSLLRPNPRTALVLAMLWCLAIGSFALAASYPLALALLFATGFVELAFNSMAQALVQINAPPAIRGRVIGLFTMAAMGMRCFAGVTVGIAGGFIGIHGSLALSALALLVAILCLLVFTLGGAQVLAKWRSGLMRASRARRRP